MAILKTTCDYINFYSLKIGTIGPSRAAEFGDECAVKQYLRLGDNINACHAKHDKTLLMIAADTGNPELVEFFLKCDKFTREKSK
ncbi:hypothetical protein D5018_18940 [Parashewanella curva]|uniref:Uncharacterized protein n=1 Tax=Parashewanella curva TaxID=2338552 RepID=A0A3L8PVN1_9GAMM|nr:ankyrin repeat domain-containing protein [Parashewanella curva]RLV58122.1 hypothetical protein D5018_18940 [Parashewanella curva]